MKNTGMVRRIDELGRIVIPKEMRKQLMMKEGESIAFSLDNDKIILTKYSLLNKLTPLVQSLLEGLYRQYQNTFLLCNLDEILMVSSNGLSRYQRQHIPNDLKLLIQSQDNHIETSMELCGSPISLSIIPLIHELNSQGALLMITEKTPYHYINEDLLMFVKDIIEQEIEACV